MARARRGATCLSIAWTRRIAASSGGIMGKKSGPPPPDPRMYEVLEKQVAQGDRLMEFIKESTVKNDARQAGMDELNGRVVKQQMDLAAKAGERADDQYNFFQTKGRPVIEQSLKDAQEWD